MKAFENWREIMEWAKRNGYTNMAKRMQINNDCWNSCGEFGRSQVAICDAMRYAKSESQRHDVATEIEESLNSDIVLECVA